MILSNQDPKPFDKVHLQWFGEEPSGEPGGEPTGDPSGEPGGEPGGEPPKEPPAKTIPTYLNYAPKKYREDPKYLDDLSKHKGWGDVLDRMYAAEERVSKLPQAPETPDGYEFSEVEFPEDLQGDDHKEYREEITKYLGEVSKEIAAFAHENGLSKEAAKAFGDLFVKQVFAQEKAARDAYIKAKTDGEEALKEAWKGDYDKNTEIARRAIVTYGKDELTAAFTEAGVENHPAIIKAFFEIGKAMGEDTLVPGSGGSITEPVDDKQAALEERYKNSPELIEQDREARKNTANSREASEELKKRYPSMV